MKKKERKDTTSGIPITIKATGDIAYLLGVDVGGEDAVGGDIPYIDITDLITNTK